MTIDPKTGEPIDGAIKKEIIEILRQYTLAINRREIISSILKSLVNFSHSFKLICYVLIKLDFFSYRHSIRHRKEKKMTTMKIIFWKGFFFIVTMMVALVAVTT